MLKLQYNSSQKKKASTNLSLAKSEFEAAGILIDKKFYREAIVHMYFSCYYTSQALLADRLKSNPSHKNLEIALNKTYGRHQKFPASYVSLHKFLHQTRNKFHYRATYTPSPIMIEKKFTKLFFYLKFAFKSIPKVEILDIINEIYESNRELIKDFSFDIYCPKTYLHHTRLTLWQPPFYRDIFSPEKICKYAKTMFSSLKVKHAEEYVIGLNSRLDQYQPIHLLMLDIDTLDTTIETTLKKIGGTLLKSGRGFHFIGKKLIEGQSMWEKEIKKIRRDKNLKKYIDKKHIDISLQRGYSTLRVTSNSNKPFRPIFYKTL